MEGIEIVYFAWKFRLPRGTFLHKGNCNERKRDCRNIFTIIQSSPSTIGRSCRFKALLTRRSGKVIT